jgi:demethylmenaquinone methyltransferase/2-methoxy-6-polyprenyl-1,4-benzoquinol methylase
MTRATLDKDPAEVAAMFDEVAARYDLTNTVLSLGQDRGWRRAVARALDLRPGERVLDLAAARRRAAPRWPAPAPTSSAATSRSGCCRSAAGPGTRASSWWPVMRCDCPSPTPSFDAVTVSFGLRNTADVDRALRELLRVTRPGGRLVVCEFSTPTLRPFRTVYVEYLMRAAAAVAPQVSSDPRAYVYLAESIRAWPAQADLARHLQRAAGRGRVARPDRRIVALHRGRRPA